MTTPNDPTMSHDSLDAVIAAYMLAVETGEVPNRQELLDRHSEHADALRAFFADLDRMDRVASPLRMADRLDATSTVEADGQSELPTVRYFGDYELLEEIARGGMGIVYKARQMSLNRLVALKMILAASFASSRDVQRFRSEAQAAANLDHPHIVPIYEVGEHEGQQYYAMKFVEGTSLTMCPQAAPRREVEAMLPVIRAVHHAHQRGVLHRDLKPSNVLVDAKGTRYVTDFGLAKRLSDAEGSITETGQVLGTPKYMPLEQAAGRKDLTVTADVYSLGVILYERLTGQPPFTGDNALTLLRQARESEPPRPSSIRPGLDHDLETVVLKCLEKEPSRRYASAVALADDLGNWLAGRPITARPVGHTERAWRWCRRNPAVACLLAVTLVALVSTAAVSTVFAVSRTRAAQRVATAYKKSEEHRIEAQNYAVNILLEQASARAENEEPVEALFRLVRALELAAPDHAQTQRSIRWALAATMTKFPEVARHLDPDDHFVSAAFSPDGHLFVTGKEDGHARIWETESGKLRKDIPMFREGSCDAIAFSPDGTAFAATNGSEVRSWSLSGDRPLGPPIPSWIGKALSPYEARVTFTADGKSILQVAEGYPMVKAQLWDVSTGQPLGPAITRKSDLVVPGGDGYVIATGKALAVGDSVKAEVEFIDTRTGLPIGDPIRCDGGPRSAALSSDNRLIAAWYQGDLTVYDARTRQQLSILYHDKGGPGDSNMLFSRDGRTLLTSYPRSVSFWDVETWRERTTVTIPFCDGPGMAFPFDSDRLAITTDCGGTSILDSSSGRLLGVVYIGESGAFDPTSATLIGSHFRTDESNPVRWKRTLFDSELWSLSPVEGSVGEVRLWAELVARSEYRGGEQPRPLDEPSWQERRRELERQIEAATVSEGVRRIASDRLYWLRCELDLAQGELHAAQPTRRLKDAVEILKRLIDAEPGQWRHRQRLGEALGGLGRYREAASAFQQALQIGGDRVKEDARWWSCTGLCLLASGDEKGYRELRHEMIERSIETQQFGRNILLLLSAGSSPLGNGPEVKRLLQLMGKEDPLESSEDGALILVRTGRNREALKYLEEYIDAGYGTSPDLRYADIDYLIPFLALVHHRLGHPVKAREFLAKAMSTLASIEKKGLAGLAAPPTPGTTSSPSRWSPWRPRPSSRAATRIFRPIRLPTNH